MSSNLRNDSEAHTPLPHFSESRIKFLGYLKIPNDDQADTTTPPIVWPCFHFKNIFEMNKFLTEWGLMQTYAIDINKLRTEYLADGLHKSYDPHDDEVVFLITLPGQQPPRGKHTYFIRRQNIRLYRYIDDFFEVFETMAQYPGFQDLIDVTSRLENGQLLTTTDTAAKLLDGTTIQGNRSDSPTRTKEEITVSTNQPSSTVWEDLSHSALLSTAPHSKESSQSSHSVDIASFSTVKDPSVSQHKESVNSETSEKGQDTPLSPPLLVHGSRNISASANVEACPMPAGSQETSQVFLPHSIHASGAHSQTSQSTELVNTPAAAASTSVADESPVSQEKPRCSELTVVSPDVTSDTKDEPKAHEETRHAVSPTVEEMDTTVADPPITMEGIEETGGTNPIDKGTASGIDQNMDIQSSIETESAVVSRRKKKRSNPRSSNSSKRQKPTIQNNDSAVNELTTNSPESMQIDLNDNYGTVDELESSETDNVAVSNNEVTKGSKEKKKRRLSSVPKKDKVRSYHDVEIEPILNFVDVEKILKKGGYVFRKDLYCRPGMDPEKNQNAVQSCDYFSTEEAFRSHLCANGADKGESWSDADEDKIRRWVRYAIVKSPRFLESKVVPTHQNLTLHQAFTLLYKAGLRRNQAVLRDYWYFPNPQKQTPIPGHTMFYKEHGEGGLWMFMIRNGLPKSLKLDHIREDERLSLELYLASGAHEQIDTFQPIDSSKVEDDTISSKRTRRKSSGSVTAVSMDSLGVGAGDHLATPRLFKKKASGDQRTRIQPPSSPVSTTETSNVASSFLVTSPCIRSFNASLSPLKGDRHEVIDPKKESTDLTKLRACLRTLDLAYLAESPTIGESNFASNMKHVMDFLVAVIRSKGEHGIKMNSPAALYVCGAPGIGKTTGVTFCCKKVITTADALKGDIENLDFEVKTCFVNAGHLASQTDSFTHILEKMCEAVGFKTQKILESSLLKRLRKNFLIVVIDEIDLLISDSKSADHTKHELSIQKLLKWANDSSIAFAFIGISNSVGNTKYARLQQLGLFERTLTFNPYSHSEIKSILDARVGESIFAPPALTYIAKKVANHNGDAREALRLAESAVSTRIAEVAEDSVTNGPLISIKHVMKAAKDDSLDIPKIIDGLPVMLKVALCVVVTLTKCQMSKTTVKALRDTSVEILKNTGRAEDMLVPDEFSAVLDMLFDHNLLQLINPMKREFSTLSVEESASYEIFFHRPLEEVEKHLNDELTKQNSFYSRLLETAKNHCNQGE